MDGECSFRLTRRYDATPAELWRALTDAESVARWLGRPLGTVLRADPPRVLELDWSTPNEPTAVVRFELTAASGGTGTVLVLDHRGIAAAVGMRALRWWSRALDGLRVAA
jgi:uncharacterized protein YndB with AHSA1/START domain